MAHGQIFGIGVDTAVISRFADKLQNPRFVNRVYGIEEQQLLNSRGPARAAEGAAANFAAKEAFLKACGRGIGGFALSEIQALRAPSGAPTFCFAGGVQEWMQQQNLRAHLSLTHDGNSATAFVVLEQQG